MIDDEETRAEIEDDGHVSVLQHGGCKTAETGDRNGCKTDDRSVATSSTAGPRTEAPPDDRTQNCKTCKPPNGSFGSFDA